MFSDPIKNVEQLGMRLGSVVADLGSGSGHYARAASKAVGESGKVYAVDIQKDMLTRLKNDASKEGFRNIEIIWGDIEKDGGTKLANSFVDSALITNLMFQIENKPLVAKEAYRILKNGGTLLLVDWSESFGGLGPHAGAIFTKEKAIETFTSAGFKKEREISAGEHHYGIIFSKQ